ncbi:hypothetical protein F5Y16DRAFT_402220 [Xylariaceae sp. FL0255]|nr:hypothetical protein F5Y16DRAFT_402220 [Xylariaceae sp. FL0255]
MPKQHTRASSSNQNRYSNPQPLPVSVSLAPSAMAISYSARPPMTLQTDFYNTVPASASALQAQAYDQYAPPVAAQPAPIPTRPSSGAWSQQDDQNLLAARTQGLNWTQIQQTYFPNKSPNACRKRHERLQERKGVDDWDARKLEKLAKEYMNMRKEIWQGLAAKTGEKWNTVEAKCMSNGLKNLQAAARSAGRRERLEQDHPSLHGYDDDSGISGIGLTPVDDLDASYSSPSAHSSAGSYNGAAAVAMHHHSGMPITYGSAGGYSSSYSSSVSSSHAYGNSGPHYQPQHHHPHHSQDNSPYLTNGQRLPSVDMGIQAIIDPQPSHGHGHSHHRRH